jgi:hypothetical protein
MYTVIKTISRPTSAAFLSRGIVDRIRVLSKVARRHAHADRESEGIRRGDSRIAL